MTNIFIHSLILLGLTACQAQNSNNKEEMTMKENKNLETAILGAGCFWCVEAVFEELEGIENVESGYSGGHIKNPCYREVCTGRTGHAEVVKVTFAPSVISFETLLSVFFKTHDPTTLNYQGNDHGTQYRSAIFYTSEEQKETAERIIKELDTQDVYSNPIVTEVTPLDIFYKAEADHQDYFRKNPDQGYCAYVIQPKMEKFRKVFKDKLK